MKLFNRLSKYACLPTFYYNCLSPRVKRAKGSALLLCKNTCLQVHPQAALEINGVLQLNDNKIKGSKQETLIRLDKGARLLSGSRFSIYYGGDIILFPGAQLSLGSGFMNSNVKVRCSNRIEVGQDVAISHDVTIMDSDAHSLGEAPQDSEVIIGNHVWIGSRVMILKNVHIGDGAVIAAGSVVTKDIPPRCLAAGVPARVIREEVQWK